ncbi:MAG TPA: 50S ribosomal protein L21 [Solirubrobacteraceae bacterium]|jgi:large subunit ribosomal protein L21|nr:50S ribosomal protein L21 [Solirubrobacteraceae bacterium]
MYAIVKTGGKQYRVERGQRLLVERLRAEEGADVALQPILYRSEEAVFDKAGLETVKVTAKVLAHVRGEKLRVFKFKPKRGYKRRTGHRQELTQIEVTEIVHGARKAAAKASAKATDKPSSKRVAAKPAGAKAAGAKPAGAKAPGAKPAAKAKTAEAPAAVSTKKEQAADGS